MRTIKSAAILPGWPGPGEPPCIPRASVQILQRFADLAGASNAAIFADDEEQPLVATSDAVDWDMVGPLSTPGSFDWRAGPPGEAHGQILQTSLSRRGERLLRAAFLFEDGVDQEGREQAVIQIRPFLTAYFQLLLEKTALRLQIDSLRAALDPLDLGVFILDRKLRLLFANRRGAVFLALSDGLRHSDASISATSITDAVRLQVAIHHVRDNSLAAREHVILALARAEKKRPLMVAVLPGHREREQDEAYVVLYVLDPDVDLRPLIEATCNLYRLSAMEGAVVAELIAGRSLSEVAASLRLKLNTVRSYLKQIFVKMGVNRQSELARVVLTNIIHVTEPRSAKSL